MEMILAIGVATLTLLAATMVLFTSLHLQSDTAAITDAAGPMDNTVEYIKRDLAGCVTPTNGTSKVLSGGFRAGNGVVSQGISGAIQVEMCTTTGALSDRQPWAEIQRVAYGLKAPSDAGATGQDLYRYVVRNLLTFNQPEVEEQFLLSGVASLNVTCYDGATWQAAWDTTSTMSVNTNLPLAVKVQLKLAGNSRSEPIQIVVPIDAVARTNVIITSTSSN